MTFFGCLQKHVFGDWTGTPSRCLTEFSWGNVTLHQRLWIIYPLEVDESDGTKFCQGFVEFLMLNDGMSDLSVKDFTEVHSITLS